MNLKTNSHHEGHEATIGRVRLRRTPYRSSQGSTESHPTDLNSAAEESAVALVITLLMLSVITFLAIAFLAMTNRDRNAVTATVDVANARAMSDAALARAQTEIIGQMMGQSDILSYDYLASHNFINPFGFTSGYANSNNVNYDALLTNGGANNPNWATNIGNLFYDPRPPVFVMTNGNLAAPQYDFRFWVDLNRNGRFETNGYQPVLDYSGNPVSLSGNGPPFVTNFFNGEPEWIGVLKYPEYVHSPTNPFIGRYAYMVLPIGKTLDLNFIHNYAKFPAGIGPSMASDGFIRDEGVGSWELNLAAFLYNLSPGMYQPGQNPLYSALPPAYQDYNYYYVDADVNTGGAFNDACKFLYFRYGHNPATNQSLLNIFGNPFVVNPGWPAIDLTNIDEFGIGPSTAYPFDYYSNLDVSLRAQWPWPGAYSPNMFYDVQDLFDPNKTGLPGASVAFTGGSYNFSSDLIWAGQRLDTTNRYTFQRLLDSIGTSSAPEYGVYVYSNLPVNMLNPIYAISTVPSAGALPPPSMLRTKVNINYNNTAQILAGPYGQTAVNQNGQTIVGPYGSFTPMPTNLVRWTNALAFFTNAADLLLRSQVFVYTNYVLATNLVNGHPVIAYYPSTTYALATFGITNIPVYNATNPGICYNEQVHRMLQLAANIYADANPSTLVGYNGLPVPQPPVFRPQFWVVPAPSLTSNMFVYITNFVLVTNFGGSNAYTQLSKGFYDLSDSNAYRAAVFSTPYPDPNFWGVPWVVGAVTNIPQFDQYSYQNLVSHERQLLFVRHPGGSPGPYDTSRPPQFTNQYYEFAISSAFAMDAWNPYSNTFIGSQSAGTTAVLSNYATITLTNNYNWGTNIYVTNVMNYGSGSFSNIAFWQPHQFRTLITNSFVTLSNGYYSEYLYNGSRGRFVYFTNNQAAFLPQDTNQTTYPTHYWSLNTTNHLFYALFDGNPTSGNLLDFVNLGPFGSSFPITSFLITNMNPQDQFSQPPYPMWIVSNATDAGTAQLPIGAYNQISNAYFVQGVAPGNETLGTQFHLSLLGQPGGYPGSRQCFGPPSPISTGIQTLAPPYANYSDSNIWMACDPFVHYTIGDLTSPYPPTHLFQSIPYQGMTNVLNLSTGAKTSRYTPWPGSSQVVNNMLFIDPLITNSDAWQFPTNLFPSVGWLGRVHRGTPWQTIYLKADNPNNEPYPTNDWATWWVNSVYTYPTNDWALLDLFTTAPNDNAARGLLSVNQTNDAAWAAVFGGVIVMSNLTGGIPLNPTTDVSYLMDSSNGINQARANTTNNPNGLFHRIGDILQASALTTQLGYVTNFMALGGTPNDEMVERIPQQTLGLLKVGLPQFVIYSWGQSLKPKNLYSSGSGNLLNICTNYEITGEYLTRTVCHVVGDPSAAAPRIVIDNFNIVPGN